MSTLEEDLRYLMETKELIRQAIFSKGLSIPPTSSFREYVEWIDKIDGGVPIEEKLYGKLLPLYKGSTEYIAGILEYKEG